MNPKPNTLNPKPVEDYFPFGMEMLNFGYKEEEYRYGFNGMEKDNEMKGKGNS